MELIKDGRCVEVELTDTTMTYRSRRTSCTSSVEEVDVMTLDKILSLKMEPSETNNNAGHRKQFTVCFARDVDKTNMRVDKATFKGTEKICDKILAQLEPMLAAKRRPKQLLVIVNPNSGRRQAKKIFHRKVEPFFQLVGITCKVIVTERPKQAQEILQSHDLTDIDGVVTVGGDGLYCECLSGLVMRAQKDAGIDYNDPDAEVVPSEVPIGIIPAGSGDYVVQYLHGTRDVMTAAIHIALGKSGPVNAVSVHQERQLSAYSGLLLGFGLFGDIMNDCEKFRWMGSSRFNIIPMGTVLRRRMFDVEVEYLPDGGSEWEQTEGKLYGVDTYVITRKPKQEKMVPCFGDTALTLFLTSKCSLAKHVQQLTKVQDHKTGCFDYEFVDQHRVQGYRVTFPRATLTSTEDGETTLAEKYYINCDGEVICLSKPQFEVRLHRNAVPLFGSVRNVLQCW
ncbi:ceramide kinase-like [Haliotis rubra]|uniref:ceramide kinase-like n=1 Tax=Haliotis rubra TaxID=36100 RepID=UPI001EE556EC|nr:ceramide kinase-like [Haliotis rubra]